MVTKRSDPKQIESIMARKKFKIRSKPKKPVRNKKHRYEESIGYESLQAVIDIATSWGAPFAECEIDKDSYGYGGYYDDCSVNLKWTGPEPEEYLQQRLVDYGRKIVVYTKWAKENKDQIAEELAIRKVEETEKTEKAVAKSKASIKKQLSNLKKKLEAMS